MCYLTHGGCDAKSRCDDRAHACVADTIQKNKEESGLSLAGGAHAGAREAIDIARLQPTRWPESLLSFIRFGVRGRAAAGSV